jgi:hypothetical protein
MCDLLLLAEGAPPEWMWPYMITVLVGLVGLLLVATLVLSAVEKWRKVFGPHPKIPQPPFETTTVEKAATVGQVEKLTEDFERLVEKLDNVRKDMATEGSRRAKNINERVDRLAEKVAGLDERSTLTAQRTVQIDQKIDRLLERRAA